MKTMITGVRPTGSITLANYIGGKMCIRDRCLYSKQGE